GIGEEQPGHASTLRSLAAYLSREASRGRHLRVVIEDGGNGSQAGTSSTAAGLADRTARDRAEVVASRLRAGLGELSAQIDVETRSRGNGLSLLPVLDGPLTPEQRRSVVIWV